MNIFQWITVICYAGTFVFLGMAVANIIKDDKRRKKIMEEHEKNRKKWGLK